MKKKLLASLLTVSLLFGAVSGAIPVMSFASAEDVSEYLISESDVPLRLYYDEEASHGVADGYDDVSASFGSGSSNISAHVNDDWERWSIPLGNGYFGANIFGRTETERIQLTEKTLANPYRINNDSSLPTDGLNNFSETYIDFGHTNSSVSDYSRELDLTTAVSTVSYVYNGVTYTREYFTSYPDKIMVIKLDASGTGNLSFTLRPTVPYEQEYMVNEGDNGGKTGEVSSSVTDGVGTIELTGKLEYFDIDFMGLYKVYTNGGTVEASTCTNADGDTDGTITVSGATGAYIVITMGTDYEICSEQFVNTRTDKQTFTTTLDDAVAKVEGYMESVESVISGKGFDDAYAALKERHLADYQELFGRVSLDLDFDENDFELTTDVLLENYKDGSGSTYLEALYFQYGRYLLIASSRKGALPANLQGTWNRYNNAPWSSGYWHNINVQMNYWPAFSTNLSETFEAYVDYNAAYMENAQLGATSIINQYNSSVSGEDGGNGWSIATGGYVSDVDGSTSIGNLGFTTQLFWEYYEYTQDETTLREVVYPVLVGAARFITKMVKEDDDGNYIAIRTDSPEQYVNGVWYYTDKGATYAQSFAYQNNYNMLLAAKELGISFDDTTHEDYAIIQTVLEQIDKYDPVRIGLSGQVKEFFEEDYYGDMGEYTHRHISQLVGLYPGNVINGTTPAWLDAAKYVLTERGDEATGWGVAHRLTLWARVQDGERAHDLLEQLLSANTATNLWDLHPPFQIDGNLGGTAGISEMLLQSHAGYIEPLAAIPSSWANGSYTGLVARGNFEVSAAWADGLATSFNIKSLSGGTASVKYSGITSATVCDSDGNSVDYTVDGNNLISFETEEGKTYVIWGFEKQTKPAAVTDLTETSEILAPSTLTWTASADAVAYKVYAAKENDSDYTLIGTTRGTSFVYTPDEGENARITFAVTAVNSLGVESDRALVYRNPDDVSCAVDSVSASIIDGTLQVAVSSNEYASKYRLYTRKNAAADWTLVQESFYPIIIEESYDSLMKYGVSAVSYFGEESEVVQIAKYSNAPVSIDYDASNILLDVQFNPTPAANAVIHAAAYGYQALTDGSMNSTTGRFSTKTADTVFFDATVNLAGTFLLSELRIFDFNAGDTYANNAGSSLKIEVLCDGVWTTAYDLADTTEIVAHRTKNAAGTRYLSFDLSGYKAQMIRISAPSPVSGKSISLYEIECSGIAVPGEKIYNENLLLGQYFTVTDASTKHLNSASGGVEALTDGTLKVADSGSTIFYTWYDQTDMQFDGTVRFASGAVLGSLRIYDYRGTSTSAASAGPQIIIEVKNDGAWTTLYDVTIDSTTISQYRKSGTRDNSADGTTEYWLEFDLGGVDADELRIYLPAKSTGNYGFYEIECDGFILEDGAKYCANVFEGYEFIAASTASTLWKGTYANLTDGDSTNAGRVATQGSSSNLDGTLSFGDYVATLETLTIDFSTYNQARSGSALIIQVLDNGVWKDALNITHDRAYQGVVTFDLGGAAGSEVRLYIPSVYPESYDSLSAGDCIAIHEVSCSGTLTPCESNTVIVDDAFEGFVFEPASTTIAGYVWGTNTYDKATDDGSTTDSTSRLATSSDYPMDGVLDFGGRVFALDTLSVNFDPYTATRCGQDFCIYTYYNGEWTEVLSHVHTEPVKAETFSLGGALAEKVRFTVSGVYDGGANSDGQTGDIIVIYEMSCSGAEILTPGEEREEVDDVFTDLEFVPGDEAGSIWEPYTYDNMTDDVSDNSNRMVTLNGAPVDAILDFEGKIALLDVFTIDYGTATRCGADLVIYAYYENAWTEIHNFTHTDAVATYTVDLGGVRAEKIRFTISGQHSTGDTIAVYEVSCSGTLITPAQSAEDTGSNILLDTTADQLTLENATAHSTASVSDLTNAFDGDKTSTRYAVVDAEGEYSLVIDIGEDTPLYTLCIYDWRGESTTRSDETTVELYVDGVWVTVIKDQPLTVLETYTAFDLMGTVASKIRITFCNTQSTSRATIYEITCTTGSESAIDRSALLEAYKALAESDTKDDAALEVIKEMKLDAIIGSLADSEATQSDIDQLVEDINAETAQMENGAPVTDVYGDLESYNLTLSDNVSVNMYGAFSDTIESDFPNAVVVIEYSDGTVEKQHLSELDKDDESRYILKLSLLAKQMTDSITVRVVFDSYNCGEQFVTSVRDYGDKVLADSSMEASHELIKAMLNYGAYAQQYFNYNVENLANDGIYEDAQNPVDTGSFGYSEQRKPVREGSFENLKPAGWTLALASDVNIRFYFATENVYAYEFSVQNSDGEVTALEPLNYVDNVWRVEIPLEDASMIDETYTLIISGEETSISISFSAMMYIDSVIAGDVTASEELVGIVKAMKLYSEAANDYVAAN